MLKLQPEQFNLGQDRNSLTLVLTSILNNLEIMKLLYQD